MSSDLEINLNSSPINNINDHSNETENDSDTTINSSNNITPIKFVNKTLNLQQQKVVKGVGACSTVAAVPQLIKKGKQTAKRVWRVLLDSGSDGDLLFVHPRNKERIPQKERFAPQKWKTSNGTFKTTKVGNLEIKFPEFSESKLFKIKPDIVDIPPEMNKPIYDLIIGVETMAKMGVIMDFAEMQVTIDHNILPMKTLERFLDTNALNNFHRDHLEPTSTSQETKRTVEILDAKYEKANLAEIVSEHCAHLSTQQRNKMFRLLTKYEELFDGTLGDFKTDPVSLKLKKDAKPYHGRPYPIPHSQLDVFRKEVERLVELGVLKRQPESEWGSPTFIIPKKNKTVRFLSDFREVNKRIIRTPFPIPKISSVLQEMEGFTYASALDLNMGYYTIRLDPDAQKVCTIILPWGKYSYLRLPMGISGSPDFFQERMTNLMTSLEYVRTYIDDLLIITSDTYDDHLEKLEVVLSRLHDAGLRVNATKSSFALHEIEYLGYILTREGIKPQPEKVSAIKALKEPTSVKELCKFLGMVQYYRDLWEKRSHLIAPLTDLVGECGHTKVTRKKKTKKKAWYWSELHQDSFDKIKECLSRDVLLAYPQYGEVFDIYTDASTRQLGAVITQNGKPLAFFSRKLSKAQRKYSITELELLSIVECLKEFKGMLWGQRLKVYTDHKNLVRDALGLTCDRVYRWRLLLEEYGPEIVYIKGEDNVVADAISRLEYDPEVNVKSLDSTRSCYALVKLFTHYCETTDTNYRGGEGSPKQTYQHNFDCDSALRPTSDNESHNDIVNHVFANISDDEDDIYPPTVAEIASEQRGHRLYKRYYKKKPFKNRDKRISLKVMDDQDILVYDNVRMVIPGAEMQTRVLTWYHHYLQHPGENRLEETLTAVMWWPGMRAHIRKFVKSCDRCQKGKRRKRKYGKMPAKIAEVTPWRTVCVDLIGPYTIKAKDGTILDFMCLTMIDPATGWFEIIELPNTDIMYVRDRKEEIVEVIIDKSSAAVSQLFNKSWLSRYPRSKFIIFDNGSEFKLHFKSLCDSYGLKRKNTTIKNPQANAILERIHAVIADMIRTSGIDMQETCTPQMVDELLTNIAWAVRSTYHTVLKTTPGAAIFGRDMLYDIPYLADWNQIGKRRQTLVDQSCAKTNKRRIDFDYAVGQKVLLTKHGILRKVEDKNKGPYLITQVHHNGTVRIQRGTINERLNVRRLTPYFERDAP